MLTMFSIPKPFRGHIGGIQRNAITSWSLLQPRPEIILFGDEEGTAEIAQELGLRHIPEIRRNEHGTPLLNDLFARAHLLARCEVFCYVNADIVLLDDFMKAVQQVTAQPKQFLMVGQRTEVDLGIPIEFALPDWETRVRALASRQGKVGERGAVDYFVFRRGLYSEVPPFALGRLWWDDWFVWRARSLRVLVVDVSPVVLAIHQNHDYAHYPKGKAAMFEGEEALANLKMAHAGWWVYTLDDTTHSLTAKGIRRDFGHLIYSVGRRVVYVLRHCWWRLMVWSAPIRHPLGLRRRSVAGLMARIGLLRG